MRLVGTITIPGKPIPKGRPRVVMAHNGRPYAYTPERTAEAEKVIAYTALQTLKDWKTTGPVELYIKFFFNSNPRTEISIWEADDTGPIPRPDVDNLAKLVQDSLISFFNDSQVVRLCAEKVGKDA